VNDNFMTADLNPQSYDLVICLGVLAHMDSPADFLTKVAALLKPGGRLILEFTDSKHLSGRTLHAYHRLCALRRPRSWTLNALSIKLVNRMLNDQHLRIISSFRYSLPPLPGIKKRVSPDTINKMVRKIFGNANFNRNAWLGSEYICLVTRDRSEGA
jgi:2-polyprenyl-3-methyl-5-hydroxy-6-metoxy-1,4-benzoquinol methylase